LKVHYFSPLKVSGQIKANSKFENLEFLTAIFIPAVQKYFHQDLIFLLSESISRGRRKL